MNLSHLRIEGTIFLIILLIPLFPTISTEFNLEMVPLEQKFEENKVSNWVPNSSNNGKSVLFDEHHGGIWAHLMPGHVSMLGGYLLQAGYFVETNIDKNLTTDYLSSYDVLVIGFPEFNYSSEEITVIHDFIQSGGSAIFVGTSKDARYKFNSNQLNPVIADLGVTINEDFHNVFQTVTLLNTSHPINQNVTGYYVKDMATMNISNSDPIDIVANGTSGEPLMVARTFGNGKAVFLSSGDLLRNIIDSNHQTMLQFVRNLFDWLAGVQSTIPVDETPYNMPIPIRYSENTSEGILRRYQTYFGNTHVHSFEGSSDAGSTVSQQIEGARTLGYDFLTITDHNSDSPTDSWAPALNHLATNNITDINVILGIEAYALNHHVVFPAIEEVTPCCTLTTDQIGEFVNSYKEQGAYVFIAHPTREWNTETQYNLNNFETLGFSGFEIVNGRGSFGGATPGHEGGIGELGLFFPFIGSSDAHSIGELNQVDNTVFVKNLTTSGLIDGILDRRNVVYDNFQLNGDPANFFVGDEDWLNEYFRRNSSLTIALENLDTLLTNLSGQSVNVTQANKFYLNSSSYLGLRSLGKSNQFLINSLKSIYNIDIQISLSDTIKQGDSIGIGLDVTYKNNQTMIPDSILDFKLYDNLGLEIFSDSVQNGGSDSITIPYSSSEGEFYLWYNFTAENVFYESGQFIMVEKGILPTTTTTSQILSSSTTTTTTESTFGFTGFYLLSSLIILSILIRSRRSN